MAFELQTSFHSGELSPKAWLRSDVSVFASSVKKMRNVIPDAHGIAESRLGFDYIEELVSETYCRLFDFDFSSAEAVIVSVTPNFIHIIDKTGFTVGDNLIANGHFSLGADSWIEQRVLFSNGLAILRPRANNNANAASLIRQEIFGLTPGSVHRINIEGFGLNGGNDFDIFIGTASGQADILNVQATGTSFEVDFTPAVASVWFEIHVAGNELDKTLDSVSIREVSSLDVINFVSPYTENDIFEMQVDKEPGNKHMYFMTRGAKPYVLSIHDGVYSFEPVIFSFGTGGSPWGTDYPGCITFHNGRMAVGGTYSKPVTIWLSQPQDYTNFDQGDAGDDDLAMELPLDKAGELVWLRSNKRLLAGLDTGEHIIFGTNGPLSPSNAQTEQHSAYGSSRAHAILVDERTFYIDSQRRAVRAMDYDFDTNGYQSEDVTFQSEHITLGRITDIKFGVSPSGQLWFPVFSGDLVGCSIEKTQKTLGWHRHDTQGKIISIALLKEFGVDVLWIAVIRNGRLFIERSSVDNLAYMDSAVGVTLPVADTVFPGFNHLIGLTVQVVADGKVHPDRVVQPNGSIIIQFPALTVVAGLGFTAEIETLPESMVTKEGNTIGHTKRYNEIYVYLLESPIPVVNGFDSYERSAATTMGEREANQTGMISIANAGWDLEQTITVSQPLPLPMRILGIGGKLKLNKL